MPIPPFLISILFQLTVPQFLLLAGRLLGLVLRTLLVQFVVVDVLAGGQCAIDVVPPVAAADLLIEHRQVGTQEAVLDEERVTPEPHLASGVRIGVETRFPVAARERRLARYGPVVRIVDSGNAFRNTGYEVRQESLRRRGHETKDEQQSE